ncbi:MT-a70 family protein [Grosmannia clavigera kw1407]|uniref:MT-a70 family protein n=1 Tax=Grosmannia clavigera (strain kw1407 / UAMH 11150) TaxID=655863 RepID=F0XUT4_GROCL|nr:MT-a70 family protein [Grosmannia clavigera kw1407]EFW98955.1 MT-a70 family protein [Grosmannia clavigera kw1407]
MPPSSAILYENAAGTIVVVDVPRSIEEAQDVEPGAGRRWRLVSAPPPTEPFPEPLHGRGQDRPDGRGLSAQLAELTTRAAVEGALAELSESGFQGPWCLERIEGGGGDGGEESSASKPSPPPSIPPGARCLAGTIAAYRSIFLAEAPTFDLVVLDPPWPNRSARRRRRGQKKRAADAADAADVGYTTVADMDAMRALLEAVPVGAKLASSRGTSAGLVAVWVTNKSACIDLLTHPHNGLFRAWGVDLVATWTWLKVTTAGEPVVSAASPWRKPWERLLLAQTRPVAGLPPVRWHLPPDRVIVGVPDVHSRKPNLRPLLCPFLVGGDTQRPLVGLEVFARNLTAGWWAWGDEALLFQQSAWWRQDDVEDVEDAENSISRAT